MGAFSVHPFLTDEGVAVEIYAPGTEDGQPMSAAHALTADAEAEMLEHADVDLDTVAAWVLAQKSQDFHAANANKRCALIREFIEHSQVTAG